MRFRSSVQLLIFGRLLNPASKCATFLQNDDYYKLILKNFNPDNVYDTLSFITCNKDEIIRRIKTNLVKKAGYPPEIIYYDMTNFYFEIEEAAVDILNEDGNSLEKGQREFGVCTEEPVITGIFFIFWMPETVALFPKAF